MRQDGDCRRVRKILAFLVGFKPVGTWLTNQSDRSHVSKQASWREDKHRLPGGAQGAMRMIGAALSTPNSVYL